MFVDMPDGISISRVGVSRDGQRAVTISYGGELLLWDVPHQAVLRRFDLGYKVHALAFDGRTLSVTENNEKDRHLYQFFSEPATTD